MARKRKKTRLQHEEVVRFFSEKLRELRRGTGKTQAELAREVLVTETYISKLEAGQSAPGVDLVTRLAKALGSTISDLLPTTPPDPMTVLHDQAKRLFDTVLRGADRPTLSLVNQFLALVAESVERRR